MIDVTIDHGISIAATCVETSRNLTIGKHNVRDGLTVSRITDVVELAFHEIWVGKSSLHFHSVDTSDALHHKAVSIFRGDVNGEVISDVSRFFIVDTSATQGNGFGDVGSVKRTT